MLTTIMFAIIGAMIHPGPIYWVIFGLYAVCQACDISYEEDNDDN